MLYSLFVLSIMLESTMILIPMIAATIAIWRSLPDRSVEAEKLRNEKMVVCLRGVMDQLLSTQRRITGLPA